RSAPCVATGPPRGASGATPGVPPVRPPAVPTGSRGVTGAPPEPELVPPPLVGLSEVELGTFGATPGVVAVAGPSPLGDSASSSREAAPEEQPSDAASAGANRARARREIWGARIMGTCGWLEAAAWIGLSLQATFSPTCPSRSAA